MRSIPVTILAGSDRKPGALPMSGAGLHPLSCYKGVAIEIEGRPLLALLVERLATLPGFGPVVVAGPARVYASLGLEARIVDTDGSVATNLRAAIEANEASSVGVMAVLSCDVLPTSAELLELRRRFEEAPPCALWLPFVRVPEDPNALGAFAWKPVYRVVPGAGGEAVRIMPGHLGFFDPAALRLPLLYRLLDATYRTRNRSVAHRRAVLLRTVVLSLVAQDLKLLLGLRLPSRTVTVVSSGLQLARALRRGAIGLPELERLVGRIFLRAHAPQGGIRLPIIDFLTLAEDIDTVEEASQLAREMRGRGSPPAQRGK